MRRTKRKTVWAYLDGKKLVDVVQAALDNNMMVDDGLLHFGVHAVTSFRLDSRASGPLPGAAALRGGGHG